MNDKEILLEKDVEQQQSASISHRSMYRALLAGVLCLLLALVVWVGVMNTEDTDYVPVRIDAPAGYACTLSVEGVEVKGEVAVLRTLDVLVITVPEGVAPGTYYVPAEMLELPQGVTLAKDWEAVLTIRAK